MIIHLVPASACFCLTQYLSDYLVNGSRARSSPHVSQFNLITGDLALSNKAEPSGAVCIPRKGFVPHDDYDCGRYHVHHKLGLTQVCPLIFGGFASTCVVLFGKDLGDISKTKQAYWNNQPPALNAQDTLAWAYQRSKKHHRSVKSAA